MNGGWKCRKNNMNKEYMFGKIKKVWRIAISFRIMNLRSETTLQFGATILRNHDFGSWESFRG
jgi:hypothetical protein